MRDWMIPIWLVCAGLIISGIYISTNKRDIQALQEYHRGGASLTTGDPNGARGNARLTPPLTDGTTHAGSSPPASKAVSAGHPPPGAPAALFWAIRQIESHDGAKPEGNNGKALGDYHITREYWQDACEHANLPLDYESSVKSRALSEVVMAMYWHRYKATTDEERARMHLGGPHGHKDPATLEYWIRVRNLMGTYRKGTE